MKRTVLLWVTAFVLTILTAYYQRVTGPTYPLSDEIKFNNQLIKYNLLRTHGGKTDCEIKLKVTDNSIIGNLEWKRFKTNDNWTIQKMQVKDSSLVGFLPYQPPAGKLIYRISLNKENSQSYIPQSQPVVIRFKGDVPIFIIIPHVILIFLAMLFSTRTGLEYFNKVPDYKKLAYRTFGLLILGGMIFGPIMQKYAFGAYWTGVPFGIDLTDNKTLIAVIGWIVALIALKKSQKPQRWIILAAILMFIVYLIPHSVLGSELDYSKMEKSQNVIEQIKE